MKRTIVAAVAGLFAGIMLQPLSADAAQTAAVSLKSLAAQLRLFDRRLIEVEQTAEASSIDLFALESRIKELEAEVPSVLAKRIMDEHGSSIYLVKCGDKTGSGFGVKLVWNPNASSALQQKYKGFLVTNEHVVRDCLNRPDLLSVSQDGRGTGQAEVNGWSAAADIALVLTEQSLDTLEWAPEAPKRGDPVVAIGAPFGLEGSISAGIVMNVDDDSVVTDAAVDPGNSGGPLLDTKGRVLGITTWRPVGAQGSNHAIKPKSICKILGNCAGKPFTW